MRRYNCILFILMTVLISSCINSNPNILVDVHEVDFLNRTSDVPEGKMVKEIMGADNIIICDTLIMVTTNNPEGQLQVFSSNTLEHLGSFCKKGRARNEMLQAMSVTKQAYYKNGNLILVVFDFPSTLYEVDITASIRNGYTVILSSQECTPINLGDVILLDNDFYHRLEYESNIYDGQEIKGVPSRYTIYKDGKKKKLEFFKSLMDINNKNHREFPYVGGLQKHPQRNLVVKKFTHMDYLLYMDFDNNKYFAIHQKGSLTFEGTSVDEEPWALHFTGSTSSNSYFMVLYRNGDYTNKTTLGDYHLPEVLVFDWDGNYITGLKMDHFIRCIEYDEKHKVLYALDYEDELYAYDLGTIIP